MTNERALRSRLPAALHASTDKPDEFGQYLFSSDALYTTVGTPHIWQHEVAHRISVASNPVFSSFITLKDFAAISHTCLNLAGRIAREYGIRVTGPRLGALEYEGGSDSARHAVHVLMSRVENCEAIFDQGFAGLAPVAEMWAICLAPTISGSVEEWLWRETPQRDDRPSRHRRAGERHFTERVELKLSAAGWAEEQAQLVNRVAAEYPPNFGGYYLRFGSFQKLMQHAWRRVSALPNDAARAHVFQQAMSCAIYLEGDEITIGDPITVLLEGCERTKPWGRDQYTSGEYLKIRPLLQRLFLGPDVDQLPHLDWVSSLRFEQVNHVLLKDQHKQQLSPSVGPAQSLLRFELGADDDVVYVNRWFIERPGEPTGSQAMTWIDERPYTDWWKEMLFFEALREALRRGGELVCPLRGWRVRLTDSDGDQQCSDTCVIRRMLEEARQWLDVVADSAECGH